MLFLLFFLDREKERERKRERERERERRGEGGRERERERESATNSERDILSKIRLHSYLSNRDKKKKAAKQCSY